ncbi:MAG TPA: tripartite tricarboxylate transporter TctB family protein [Beijerinckiaceae bacterium]|nr:tripartite tricarboxylate transporter TctB family protein [Beijerinckiaceae bacterium]
MPLSNEPPRPARRFDFHSDFAIAGGIVAFCAVVYAVTMTFPQVPAALASGMGPEVFPRLLLGVMVLLAGVLAFVARGKPDEMREPVPRLVPLTALGFLAFPPLAWLVGLLLAAFLLMVGFGLLWGERRRMLLVASAAFLCLLIYVVFVKGFAIPLPRGVIVDWLF